MNTAKKMRIKPGFKITLGFLAIILIGALLLHLPFATLSGKSIPLIDCFFTSFSAVCVTGLSVFTPGLTLSPFGQGVLLVLIQLGGLGFMTATSTILLLIGKKFTLQDRLAISSSFGEEGMAGVIRLMKNAVLITFGTELAGSILLAIRFIPAFGAKGIWYSVFHSVSAFCNAGFDVLADTANFTAYYNDPLVLLTLSALIIIGGLGFLVVLELSKRAFRREKKRTLLSLHTRVVLVASGALLVTGMLLFALFEWNNPDTIGNMSVGDKLLNAFFQSVTTRTAGFSSFAQGGMTSASKLTTIVFMLIGASPAGTGGGFKTTTLAVMLALFVSVIRGRSNVSIFRRSITRDVINKALALILMVVSSVVIFSVALCAAEGGLFTSEELVFEVCSAFGTVGLSCGITSALSAVSKVLLMMAMFTGRVGMLSLLTGLTEQFAKNRGDMEYPEGKLLIG